MVLVYAAQKMILLVSKEDPEILTTKKLIPLNETAPVLLGDNGFDMMIWLSHLNKSTLQSESVDLPPDIGHFRMVHTELFDNN